MLNEFHKLVIWRQHRTLHQNTVNHSNLVIHLKLHYTENKSTIFFQATSLSLHCVGVGFCGGRGSPFFLFLFLSYALLTLTTCIDEASADHSHYENL